MNRRYTGTTDNSVSEREKENDEIAYDIAKEGIVMLKNDGILPLNKKEKIALFGAGADKTVKGGIGSGDVNNRYSVSIYEGMRNRGFNIADNTWINDYNVIYDNAREKWKSLVLNEAKKMENPFDAYASNPFLMPNGRSVTKKDIAGVKKVVYVVSRISGEGHDRRKIKGDYYLSDSEREDIMFLNEHDIKIILIINSGGQIELTDILKEAENISAVLYMAQLGQQGGNAIADVLSGKVNVSGKLTSTWGKRYEDYPGADTFGYINGDVTKDSYDEGIYVGYRYFDKMNIAPLFPFGFGLSYTDFSIEFINMRSKDSHIYLEFRVTNTGDTYSGKEVVQVYAGLPFGGEERELKRLVAYGKTEELKCGQSQNIVLSFAEKEIASYDEDKKIWYITEGKYDICVGNSSNALKKILTLQREYSVIEDTLTNNVEYKKTDGMYQDNSEAYSKQNEETYKNYEYAINIANTMQVDELVDVLYGYVSDNASTLGASGIRVPGSAGETTGKYYDKYGLRPLIMADGPAGIRLHRQYEVNEASGEVYAKSVLGALENGYLEPFCRHDNTRVYYQYCTAFPVGVALAQTWNTELIEKFGRAIAKEMKEFNVDLWLAPGMNIQRNPLCGRNFEYYSEDPYLTGRTALSVIRGVQSEEQCGVTVKHFACNNQEDNRMNINVKVSERALREIYLRGFEIAIREGHPRAVMTSYNLINNEHTANSRWLCNDILRQEWGFEGVVMSDWNTTVSEDGSIPYMCIKAGNDLIMPGNIQDRENILSAYNNNELSIEDIKRSAIRIIELTYEISRKKETI